LLKKTEKKRVKTVSSEALDKKLPEIKCCFQENLFFKLLDPLLQKDNSQWKLFVCFKKEEGLFLFSVFPCDILFLQLNFSNHFPLLGALWMSSTARTTAIRHGYPMLMRNEGILAAHQRLQQAASGRNSFKSLNLQLQA